MLDSIKVKNFGCFDDYQYAITFKKLNIIMGPNNSGKSTIFKALNLVRNFPFGGLTWNSPFFSLQSAEEAIYGHDITRDVIINVKYIEENDNYDASFVFKNNSVVDISFLKNGGRFANLASEHHQKLASKIWYFVPNREPTPYQTDVSLRHVDIQPLSPAGIDIASYLLARWTDRDPNWKEAEKWLKKIDPQMALLKTPVINGKIRMSTDRNDGKTITSVNMSLQGTGLQNAATIIAGIIFSPPNATIIIEEPENFLHQRTIKLLVDLFNYAVNDLSKQIIVTTHSGDILREYISDIGEGTPRGQQHIRANPDDFKLITFTNKIGAEKIQDYELKGKKFQKVISDFQALWG